MSEDISKNTETCRGPCSKSIFLPAVLFLIIIATLATVSSLYPRPGIYYDNIIRVCPLVPLLEPGVNRPYRYPLSFKLFDTEFPLVLKDYIGNVSIRYLPAFGLFGISTTTWHTANLISVCLSLFVLCIAFYRAYGLWMPLIFLLLSLVDYGGNYILLLSAVALASYVLLTTNRAHPKFFIFPFFLLGLVAFTGLRPGLILPAYFLHQILYLKTKTELKVRTRLLYFCCFVSIVLLFASPLLYHNLTKGKLIRQLYYSITDVSEYNKKGIDNGRLPTYSKSLQKKKDLLLLVLNHRSDGLLASHSRVSVPSSRFVLFFLITMAICLPCACITVRNLRRSSLDQAILKITQTPTLLIFLICCSISFFVVLIPDANGPHHVRPLMPYLKMLFAALIVHAGSCSQKYASRPARISTLLLCASIAIASFLFLFRNYLYIQQEVVPRASKYHTPYLYDLIERTNEWKDKTLCFLHWGIDKQVYLFAEHHPSPILLFHGGKKFQSSFLKKTRKNPGKFLFITYGPANLTQGIRREYDKFFETAKDVGAQPELYDAIVNDQGENVIEIYRLTW